MKLTSQQVYDTVLNGLREQGEASQGFFDGNTTAVCAYRGKTEHDPSKVLKCAAGMLIDNSAYLPDMEGKTADLIYEKYGAFGDKLDAIQVGTLVMDLQRAHDEQLTKSVDAWESRMESIAKDYSLTYSPPGYGG